jgi:hypothetical protein
MSLFLNAFLQVFLVGANTYFIAKLFYPGVIVASFSISWLWTGNVKRISLSSNKERFIYSLGACLGGITGLIFSKIVVKII